MKMKKIIAGISALSIAASMAVTASASSDKIVTSLKYGTNSNGLYQMLFWGEEKDNVVSAGEELSFTGGQCYGVAVTFKVDSPEVWAAPGFGGSIGVNDDYYGWTTREWACAGWRGDDDTKVVYTTDDPTVFVVDYENDGQPILDDDDMDEYGGIVFQAWQDDDGTNKDNTEGLAAGKVEILGVRVYDADGNDLYAEGTNAEKGEPDVAAAEEEESGTGEETEDSSETESEDASDTESEEQTDASSEDEASSEEDSSAADSSEAASSAADTSSAAESTAASTTSTASSTNNAASTTGTTTNTKAATTTNPVTTTTSTAPAASGDNKGTGAAAGIALAGVALAGAAIAVTKKKQ